ncbi:MAG: ATP-binding protein [Pyrinomonadaceae bacterium]
MKDAGNDANQMRKTPWLLGAVVVMLGVALIFLQSTNVWKTLNVDSASYTLLLYALSSLNFIAFVIFAFILTRSLLKLRQERKARLIGSKLKTRLLIYFFTISILPLIAMAIFSYLFMNRALDRWFTRIPENVIRSAESLSNVTARERFGNFRQFSNLIAEDIDANGQNSRAEKLATDSGFVLVETVNGSSENVLYTKDIPKNRTSELIGIQTSVARGNITAPIYADGKGFDVLFNALKNGATLVCIYDTTPTAELKNFTESSLRELDQLKTEGNSVRGLGLMTLGLLTFLLIFASTWIAFFVAKGLTRPIRALAEGAEKISHGDYGFRVNAFADDEIQLLVDSFNKMSAALKENSEELEERRKYIETVLHSLSTGVISFDENESITTINKAARGMLRLAAGNYLGERLENVVNEENTVVLQHLMSRAKRIGHASEQTSLSRDETEEEKSVVLPVALTATALESSNGVVLVIEDLSDLISAQRASAWREVARRMAHEIKNPLTPIQLSAERIAKRFISDSAANGAVSNEIERNKKVVKEGTETIIREVTSLKSMVNEFSRFARLPNPKLEPGDLNSVIEKTVALYDDRLGNLQIETKLDAELPEIQIDAEQMKRVFVNLIDNAVESFAASDAERIIKINTLFDPARDLIIAEVSDNGSGINPKDFQKLFQPYFSTKGRGTGLGLAIVSHIVNDHHGKIRGTNNTEKGAKFTIELPTSN